MYLNILTILFFSLCYKNFSFVGSMIIQPVNAAAIKRSSKWGVYIKGRNDSVHYIRVYKIREKLRQ
jgi:hypothetical protein